MTRAGARRVTLTLAAAAVVVGLAVAVVVVMGALHRAARAADVVAIDETAAPKDYPAALLAQIKLVEVDLDREASTMQLDLTAVGADMYDPESLRLNGRLTVQAGDAAAPAALQTIVIARGDKGTTVPVELDLGGNVQDYPRDVHRGRLLLLAIYEPVRGGPPQKLPILLKAYGAWPGLDVEFATPHSSFDGDQMSAREVALTLRRSHATVTVAYFSIALTWVLIITVVGMTMSVVLGQREPQLVMLAFFGTLLFGLTEFRNMLPGAPPSGAYSDYLAFYWAYGVVIVAVGVIGGLWLYRRGSRRDRQAGAAGEDDALAGDVPADPADFS